MPDEIINKPEPKPAKKKAKSSDKKKNATPFKKWPPYILMELDKLFLQDQGAMRVQQYLLSYHGSAITVPSVSTLHRYRLKRLAILEKDVDLRTQIEYSVRPVDMMMVNNRDQQQFADALRDLICERIEVVKKINHRNSDPRYEKTLVDLLAKGIDMIETQVKVEQHGKFMDVRMAATVTIISKHLVDGVVRVYKETHGDKKLKEFSEAMDTMVKDLDFDAIEAELAESITANKKEAKGAVITVH